MGALRESKGAMAEVMAQGEQVVSDGRSQVIQGVMDDLRDTLTEPTYEGDVETALIHHLGEGAFHDDGLTERYTSLAVRIDEEAAKDKRREVPVLMMYAEHPEDVGRRTVFMRVPKGGVQFRSEEEREEDVLMHAFTGAMVEDEETGESKWQPTTATVTHKRLSIVASASTFSGDILKSDEPARVDEDVVHGFTLSESHTADGGHGSGMPSGYAFSNYSINRLGGGINDLRDEDIEIFVGWEEIDAALMDRIAAAGKPDLEEVERLEEFFRVVSDVSGFEVKAPRINSVMRAAGQFQKAVAEA
jgi:hypothetical protein